MKTIEEILNSKELQSAVDEFCENNDLCDRNGIHNRDEETVHELIDIFVLGYVAAARDAERNPVSIHYGENNTPDGVLVQTLDERFVIELHNIDEGKGDFSFNTAQQRLKELGKTTFNKKQGLILAAYIEEINAALVEAGGEPFAKGLYTSGELYKPVGCADYNGNFSWYFNGSNGCFITGSTRYGGGFRSRPVLDYNQA